MKAALSSPPLTGAIIALASIVALATAYGAQYIGHLVPCPLCLAQRVPYALAILIGIGIINLRLRPKLAALFLLLAALCFAAGAGIAFYHNGVEHHWWESFLEGCKVTFTSANATNLLQQIEAAAPSHCDQIPWSDPVLHLSMAAWNVVASAVLSVFSLAAAIFTVRRANGF